MADDVEPLGAGTDYRCVDPELQTYTFFKNSRSFFFYDAGLYEAASCHFNDTKAYVGIISEGHGYPQVKASAATKGRKSEDD